MRKLRTAVPAALVAALLGVPPASAAPAAVGAVGTVGIDCFGCGVSDCHASLTVTGVVGTIPVAGGAATTECLANEPIDATCVISGSASGRVEGAVNVDFNWTRVGATAVVTTSGDINGSGAAVFIVTSPIGAPCGQPVDALVTVEVGGDGQGGPGPVPNPSPERVAYNDGETGFLLLRHVEDLAADGPTTAHDLDAVCTFKLSRHTGLITVVGRVHAGRHPVASATQIRCRLVDTATGVVLFDETRTEGNAQARLEGVVAGSPNRLTVCTRGEGWWGDDHDIVKGMDCQTP